MLPGDPGLPPGVSEYMIPGNRPEDAYAERLEEAVRREVRRAIRQGDLPSWTDPEAVWRDVEDVVYEWGGDADEDEIAAEAVERYIERRRMEDGDEEAA